MNRHKQHVMRLVRSRQAEKQVRAQKIAALKKDLDLWVEIAACDNNPNVDFMVSHTRAKLAELGA